jgi:PAS domain S-box-containing protein
MGDQTPIYNSRNYKIYLEFTKKNYPHANIDSILKHAGMTIYEVADPGHWFNQHQVDLFHEALAAQTRNPNVSREAGRYTVSSEGLGTVKQYGLGFMSLASVYLLIEKLYPRLSRGAIVKAKKLGPDKIEIVCAPKPGVNEKPYQCEHRMGIFESLAKAFTEKLAKVEHPSCFHKGDDSCRYIITWEKTPSLMWKRVRNYSLLFGILISLALSFVMPITQWAFITLLFAIFTLILSFISSHLERAGLLKTIETQGDTAKGHLDEINIRYNNALLVQEIGQATSTNLDVDDIINSVVNVMEKRLDFDRGTVMLANREKTRLVFTSGYGYGKDLERLIRGTEFHLDNPESKGVLVLAFREQRPFLVNDIAEIEKNFSKRSREFVKQMGIQSLICAPIVYENESLGILAVDNMKSKRPLTQSDISLLTGVASQTAVSIVNAWSFQRVQESEKKYRELVENANSIILRMDTQGNITFFNEFAQKFFGYSEDEILGRNILGTILSVAESTQAGLENLVMSLRQDPEQQYVSENENVLRNGDSVWIAWTYKPIFDSKGKFIEILSIGNDITELKRAAKEKEILETQLQHAQRMEAIGTLAGGIAHDFNNILGAIIGYTEMALYEEPASSKNRNNMDEVLKAGHRAKDLVQQILSFSRQSEQERQPVLIHLIIKEALKLLRASLPSTIEIRQNVRTDLGAVLADPTQIHQVMMNLCTNAHHAMSEKGGELGVTLSSVDLDAKQVAAYSGLKPGSYLKLTVSDTGHGMDRITTERIFDPYFTTKEKGVGTGLGLAVVHGIVKSHGGMIAVDSRRGKGTVFNVFFPRIETQVKAEAKTFESLRTGSERILFVDDEQALVDLGKQMLESLGYQAECRTSSIEALNYFRSQPDRFDLVITDMTMPTMTGERMAKEMMEIRQDIPIILCTGYSERITREEAIEIGIKEFVLKPFRINDFAKTIRKVLDES